MFGQETFEPLPEIYLTDYQAWDGYMARLWESLIQAFPPLSDTTTILEIAPGSSAKIGRALQQLGFRGMLTVVEPHPKAGKEILSHYRSILPQATVTLISKKLEDCLESLPQRPDWVMANHSLDDMILAAEAPSKELEALFGWTTTPSTTIPEVVISHWQRMNASPEMVNRAINGVTDTWCRLVEMLAPRRLILSQYGSSALQDAGMEELNRCAKQVLSNLQRSHFPDYHPCDIQPLLNQQPHHRNHYIGTELLNASHWWAIERRADA